MGVETELKFRVPAKGLKAVRKWKMRGSKIGSRSESDLITAYYDTPKHKLRRHGLSLRVRRMGNRHVQTIKSASPDHLGRGEWEMDLKGDTPDLGKVKGTPLERLASRKLARKLNRIFETSVHRISVPVHLNRSEIELAFDRGEIRAGRRCSPIDELELELRHGRPSDLFRLAKALERKSGAELSLRSKAERGYDLVERQHHGPFSAEPITLDADMAAPDAFRTIARSCLRQATGNVDAVHEGDPEGVHQLRVGLRRLRAAIAIFSGVLPGRGTRKIKTELKWLTGELAPAREIDVFIEESIKPAAGALVPRRGGRALEQEFSRKRDEALERAQAALSSQRFRDLLIDLLQWIEATASHSTGTKIPIREFAANVLHRRIRKVRKRGKNLAELSAQARHKLRIRIKKIRYALEFFESLFPAKNDQRELGRASRRLKHLQDSLGSLNDFAAHRKMAADVALAAPRRHGRARAFASGILVGREDEAAKPLLKAAAAEVKRLRPVHV
jgi:inorganic triphosphatase YgiF